MAQFDPFNLVVTPEEFECQLIKLRTKTVLPLRVFARLHVEKKLPRHAVAITFDDGYACNALTAAPMLERFGYPATFFIMSDAIERSEEFWWDQLEFLVRAPQFDYQTAIERLDPYSPKMFRRNLRHGSQLAAYLALWKDLRDISVDERRKYFACLRGRMSLPPSARETYRPMTPTELRSLASNPLFEIGGHTVTHSSLPTQSLTEQKQEIIGGARRLEAIIDKPVRSFSYPYGHSAPVTRDIVIAAGFECAVTTEHRKVSSGDCQFELPRRQVVARNAPTLEVN